MMDIPPFIPHRMLPSGHLQTIAGAYLKGHSRPYLATQHHVDLGHVEIFETATYFECPMIRSR